MNIHIAKHRNSRERWFMFRYHALKLFDSVVSVATLGYLTSEYGSVYLFSDEAPDSW